MSEMDLPVYSIFTCAECGAGYEDSPGTWEFFPSDIRGRWTALCPDCAEGHVVCACCEEVVEGLGSETSRQISGFAYCPFPVPRTLIGLVYLNKYNVCEGCIDVDYSLCNDCGGFFYPDDLVSDYRDNRVCGDCFDQSSFTCAACDEVFPWGFGAEGTDGSSYCPSCWREHFFVCDECGDTFRHDDCAGDGVCEDCSRSEPDDVDLDERIGYHDLSAPDKFGFGASGVLPVSGRPYHMGLELEYDRGGDFSYSRDVIPRIRAEYEFCFISLDSSVTWGEIVTRPESYETLIESFDSVFDLGLRSRFGLIVGPGTGLHVNLSRSVFQDRLEIAYFVMVINNFPDFSRFCAGRKTLYSTDYKAKTVEDAREDTYGTNKYEAVRVGSDRLEVRIYKSTSDIGRLRIRLQHTIAAAEYAIRCARSSQGLIPDFEDFLNFIEFHSACWPELDDHRLLFNSNQGGR